MITTRKLARLLSVSLALLLTGLSFSSHAPVAAGAVSGDSSPESVARREKVASQLIGEEAVSGGAYAKLSYLTDRIGPRLSGSPGAAAAVAWAVEEFRRDGFSSARTERVMVPHWVRGEESAMIVSPATQRLAATAVGMSVPTPPEGITAGVIEVSSFDELHARGNQVAGKIVLFNKPIPRNPDGGGYGSAAGLRYRGASEAGRQGAVAMLIRSLGTLSARLPHTGALGYEDGVARIPAAAIAAEDADLLHRLIAAGSPVEVKLTLGCQTLPEAESANVVAEIRGRSRPDEFVVIGGHLDSWDLGTGAIDDGAGVAVTMEAMRLLRKLSLKPRRSIRGVLFMNEENGGHGGRAYVDEHGPELDRHVAAIESDSGAGRPLGFDVTAGDGGVAMVAELASALKSLGATRVQPEGGGSDIEPMRAAGVPLLGLRQDMSEYFDWHHTAGDTLDKVDPRELADNAVAMAFMAYALADREAPLPRIPPEARKKPRN